MSLDVRGTAKFVRLPLAEEAPQPVATFAPIDEAGWPLPWAADLEPATTTIPLPWSWEMEDPLGFLPVVGGGTDILPSGVRYLYSGEDCAHPPPAPAGPTTPAPTTVSVSTDVLVGVEGAGSASSGNLGAVPSSLNVTTMGTGITLLSSEFSEMPNLVQPMKQGDRRPAMIATLGTLNPDGTVTPDDLTGMTVVLNMSLGNKPIIVDGACVINNPPTAGVVQYNWANGDTNTVGDCDAEFKVTDGSGLAKRYPNTDNFVVKIIAQVGP